MKRTLIPLFMLFYCAVSACSGEVEPALDEARSSRIGTAEAAVHSGTEPNMSAESERTDRATPEKSYIGGCPGAYPVCTQCGPSSCGSPCCAHETEPGFELWYPDNCSSWVRPDLQKKPGPGLLCHLDKDTHLFKVEVEFYVVDLFEDRSCAHGPDRYIKSKKGSISCSHFTGLFDPSTCEGRAKRKLEELMAQGYIPIVSGLNDDRCPTGAPVCTNSAECNNGRFCDGVEQCLAGQCFPGQPPCPTPGSSCNEAQARCTGAGSGCSADADCNDGLFCNGVERCNAGRCEVGERPCSPPEERCNEALDRCLPTCGTNGRICP